MCYISNFSYLSDASFVVMREHLLSGFDRLWVDSLNGDSRMTGKRTPDGAPDPSIFSTPHSPVGIRKGTAIALMVRDGSEEHQARSVAFRDLWGTRKREELLESLTVEDFDALYRPAEPSADNRFSFRPLAIEPEYLTWPSLPDLCAESPSNGLMEKRRGALIDMNRDALAERMKLYYDDSITWEKFKSLHGGGLTRDAARYDAEKTRSKVHESEAFDTSRLRRYAIRPFDFQWAYYSPVRPLWNEPRPTLWARAWEGNEFLITRFNRSKTPEGPPFYFTSQLSDDHLLDFENRVE